MIDKETKAKQADRVFETVCAVLDEKGLKYERDDKERVAIFGGTGKDMTMKFAMSVDEPSQLVKVDSILPFTVPDDRQVDIMAAICITNQILKLGAFRFSLKDFMVDFTMGSCFLNSIISKDAISFMLELSIMNVEDFNDKLYMISMGRMTPDEYVDFIKSL